MTAQITDEIRQILSDHARLRVDAQALAPDADLYQAGMALTRPGMRCSHSRITSTSSSPTGCRSRRSSRASAPSRQPSVICFRRRASREESCVARPDRPLSLEMPGSGQGPRAGDASRPLYLERGGTSVFGFGHPARRAPPGMSRFCSSHPSAGPHVLLSRASRVDREVGCPWPPDAAHRSPGGAVTALACQAIWRRWTPGPRRSPALLAGFARRAASAAWRRSASASAALCPAGWH